ncbi:major capsid protein [Arthrobacter phage Popper]|uniref:Major capsid protein n=1 Tax=Arthrobacter phage Popper TaxID=2859633 RepID=A0AAE7WDI1_9CAUD|nr:major capsid protein [Arthrobacter phage Popper]QYC54927.1 major capsid protein [Arthrobacter phage Popper]
MYTYPAPPATIVGGNTIDIHYLLKTPPLIARRLRTLLEQRYIADYLLAGRFTAQGGSILYETGEPIYTNDDPEAVAPGAGYPKTQASGGSLASAKTSKWGQDIPVTDEVIARLGIDPVNRAFTKLVNQSVRFVDSAALGVIASKITQTFNVTAAGNPGAWTTGEAIVEGVLLAKAQVTSLDEGYDPNVIVLTDAQWAKAVARLNASGLLPREAGNPLVTGEWPQALGLTWTSSNHSPSTNPILVDNTQLGGMADEEIGGPGYIRTDGVGVETKAIRKEDTDSYLLRARRVTVPVVLEPNAGIIITNTGV